MVLKYVVNDASWPALWMGVSNVIANALVMLRYVLVKCRLEVRRGSHTDSSQLRHPVGEPEYGGRLHLQPGFVRLLREHVCVVNIYFRVYLGITCQIRDQASEPFTCLSHAVTWLTQSRASDASTPCYLTVNATFLYFLVTELTPRLFNNFRMHI